MRSSRLPHDVVTPDRREALVTASPYNAVRLLNPESPAEAARLIGAWQDEGVLVRETEPAVWILEETFPGLDGGTRTRRGLVARVELSPYSEGKVLPHERTFGRQKDARLELLRAVRMKLSPVFLVHEGASPAIPERAPDMEATLDGVTSRLWRIAGDAAIAEALGRVEGRLLIADGHHRYETALAYHEEQGTEESGYVLATLVSRDDDGLEILPTHRLVSGEPPELDGSFRLTDIEPSAEAGTAALAGLDRDHPAFVLLRRDSAQLAESEGDRARHRRDRPPAARGRSATRRARSRPRKRCEAAAQMPHSSCARRRSTRSARSPVTASCCRRRRPTSSQS